jgi:hypothetical protein
MTGTHRCPNWDPGIPVDSEANPPQRETLSLSQEAAQPPKLFLQFCVTQEQVYILADCIGTVCAGVPPKTMVMPAQ